MISKFLPRNRHIIKRMFGGELVYLILKENITSTTSWWPQFFYTKFQDIARLSRDNFDNFPGQTHTFKDIPGQFKNNVKKLFYIKTIYIYTIPIV